VKQAGIVVGFLGAGNEVSVYMSVKQSIDGRLRIVELSRLAGYVWTTLDSMTANINEIATRSPGFHGDIGVHMTLEEHFTTLFMAKMSPTRL
jgi:hypothetical protein